MKQTTHASDLAKRAGVPVGSIAKIFDEITREVRKGNRVTIKGFGAFDPKEMAARKGSHPATGKPIDIPARTGVRFKAARALTTEAKE